jgi:hypothetical protein
VGPLLVAWQRGSDPGEQVLIGTAGVAFGPAGAPLSRYLYENPERAADARFLRANFAPFETVSRREAGGDRLRFAGAGRAPARASERRMVGEWVRVAAEEAAGGRGGAAYALALAWHRGGGTGGGCDDVAVYLTGEVRASACGWGEEVRGRLAREALDRLYGWFDRYRPFQRASEEEDAADVLPERMLFAGAGQSEVPPAERAAMQAFAAALHRELAARRAPAAAPQAPAGTEPGEAPARKPAQPSVPPPPPQRLLRPPDPAPGRPTEVLVPQWAMPKTPPPLPPQAARQGSPPAGE